MGSSESGSSAVRIVRLSGEYDVTRQHTLAKELEAPDSACGVVIVDMSDVIYLDSIALGMLRAFQERVREGGGSFRIVAQREHIKKIIQIVGLDKTVTVVEGDALKVMPTLEAGIDFVFIDALKPDYLKYFKILEPKLVRGATVVADNVIVSARQMSDFLSYVQSSPNYDSVVIRASLHKNDGMLIGFKIA